MPAVLLFNLTASIGYAFWDDEGRCGIILTALGAVEEVIGLEEENGCQSSF